jgi:hypothetical protein
VVEGRAGILSERTKKPDGKTQNEVWLTAIIQRDNSGGGEQQQLDFG